MSTGRVLSSGAAVLAVGGAVVVAIGMSGATAGPDRADETPFATATSTTSGYSAVPWASSRATPATRSSSAAATHATSRPAVAPTTAHPAGTTSAAAAPAPKPAPITTVQASSQPALVRGQSLPVAGTTSDAARVITVVAHSYSSTTATLQAWVHAPGGGWLKHGSPVLAHVGSDGLSTQPSETRSATPIGSFTLTQAFGAYANPGTGLPYFRTTSADWWISESSSLYNTHQHCSGSCPFTQGSPNEHLLYETPYYNYAMVIDYNTRNSPTGVRQGAGSAYFLHVTDGAATAGCVAIPQSNLVSIMQWLAPSTHPRILIGVA